MNVERGTQPAPNEQRRTLPVSREIADLLRRPEEDDAESVPYKRRIADYYARNVALRRYVPEAADAYERAEISYARAVAPRVGIARATEATDAERKRRAAADERQQALDTKDGDAAYAAAKAELRAALARMPELGELLREGAIESVAAPRGGRVDDRPQSVLPFSLADVAERAFGEDRLRRL